MKNKESNASARLREASRWSILNAKLRVENDKFRKALGRIAWEPQGESDASYREVLEAVTQIAKDALAIPVTSKETNDETKS